MLKSANASIQGQVPQTRAIKIAEAEAEVILKRPKFMRNAAELNQGRYSIRFEFRRRCSIFEADVK